jgi:uncharacterized SAM-binding protein YcdF (DUF218 family)
VLHSTGRARLSLLAHFVTVVAAAIGILLLVGSFAEQGIAWALVIGAAIGYLAMGLMALVTLKREQAAIAQQ